MDLAGGCVAKKRRNMASNMLCRQWLCKAHTPFGCSGHWSSTPSREDTTPDGLPVQRMTGRAGHHDGFGGLFDEEHLGSSLEDHTLPASHPKRRVLVPPFLRGFAGEVVDQEFGGPAYAPRFLSFEAMRVLNGSTSKNPGPNQHRF